MSRNNNTPATGSPGDFQAVAQSENDPVAVAALALSAQADEAIEALRDLGLVPERLAEDFFIQKNTWVYEAIQELNRAGIVPDYIARPLACAVVFRVGRVASRLGGARCVPAPLRRGRLIEGLFVALLDINID